MSFENAKKNLEQLGAALNLELIFDKNNTCTFRIDDVSLLKALYEANSYDLPLAPFAERLYNPPLDPVKN